MAVHKGTTCWRCQKDVPTQWSKWKQQLNDESQILLAKVKENTHIDRERMSIANTQSVVTRIDWISRLNSILSCSSIRSIHRKRWFHAQLPNTEVMWSEWHTSQIKRTEYVGFIQKLNSPNWYGGAARVLFPSSKETRSVFVCSDTQTTPSCEQHLWLLFRFFSLL